MYKVAQKKRIFLFFFNIWLTVKKNIEIQKYFLLPLCKVSSVASLFFLYFVPVRLVL